VYILQSITLDATVANIETVTDFVNGLLEASDCPMKAQIQIDVAIDELFCNIASYAYGDEVGQATVTAGYNEEKKQFELTFIDSGLPYNPLEKEDPDVTLKAEDREIGGLGIFLVKNTMDDVSYQYVDGKNMLTIIKKY